MSQSREARCEVCGAPLTKEGEPCLLCGNSNELSSFLPPASAQVTGSSPATAAPRRRKLLYISLTVLGILLFLAVALAAGIYSGLQEVKQRDLATAEQHYQRGVELLQAGDYALAVAEFEYVERIRPSYRDTGDLLARAREAMLNKPTPTSQAREDISASLLARAQDEMEQEAWSKAIATLQELQKLAPDYKPEQVKTLLFQSTYSAGLQSVQEGNLEAALEWFKQAREIDPSNADARRQIALASSYLAAMSTWGSDWAKSIEQFKQLYQLSPDYADVKERLTTAYSRYADHLSADGEWCAAATAYAQALELAASATVSTKAALASKYCEATPGIATAEPSAMATAETKPGASQAPLPGRASLYFAMIDPGSGSVGIYVLAPGSEQKPRLLVANGDQPAVRSDDSLAYRNLASDQLGISLAQEDGSLAARISRYAEDAWPTWEAGDGRIAFASIRESDRKWRVYVADNWYVGAEASSIAYGKSPAWGPTGLIAYRGCDPFGNNCGIYLMRPDGSQVGQATDNSNDDMPAWSPDGSRLAFASPRSGTWSIWVKDLKTNRLTQLTDDQALDASPVWSPDGKSVAFLSNRSSTWGIWLVSASGGAPELLWELGSLPRNWDEFHFDWR
ncbi:MAG: tetratricopeptide repeat protein [Anaerolineae bacterium]